MKRNFLLQLVVLLVVFSPALAVDLNAPAEKKITVRSEIARGWETVMSGFTNSHSDQAPNVSEMISNEKLKNTDTDGFLLGADLGAWWLNARIASNPDDTTRQFPALVESNFKLADVWFKEFRDKQREMKLSDKQLADVVGMNYDQSLKPLFDEYSARSHL
jgi:hypothetical protein